MVQEQEAAKPSNFPAWLPKPTGPPVFSSQTFSNPFFKPSNFIDLTTSHVGMTTNQNVYDDRFGASDPYTYIDSAKANENIKALLEGAFEDEEDMPRTRLRTKKLEEKLDLVDKLKSMSVEGNTDAADEEEAEEDDGTVEGLKVKLLPHQIEGVAWMQDKELGTKKTRGVLPKGGILADDMGLGKTIQSIALMLMNPMPPPSTKPDTANASDKEKAKLSPSLEKGTLVVAPLALIKQWEAEIKDRVEDTHMLNVCVHHGPQRAKSFKALRKYDVVITTYHTLVSEHASSEGGPKVGCFGLNWYRIILDEAHSIKNRNAKATKAACALNAEYRWCLTGTPMQNNLDELQSLIHFLRIKPYEDLNAWRDQITRPMSNGRGGLAIKRLQVYLKAFMKRRTKNVLKQEGALKNGGEAGAVGGKRNGFKVVKRTIEKIEVDFTSEERAFYERLESRADKSLERMMAGKSISYASALVLLLRLRQACNHPELVKGDLAKESETFTNGSGTQTPSRRKAAGSDDMDSIADMLGGLSVATKRCDVCSMELTAKESSGGAIRCVECETNLENVIKPKIGRSEARQKQKASKQKRRDWFDGEKNRRRGFEDSINEDDKGAWILQKSLHPSGVAGKAGERDGQAPGGVAESLRLESDDEDVKPFRRKKPEVVDLITDDEESDGADSSHVSEEGSDEESSSEDDEDSWHSSKDDLSKNMMMSTKIRHLLAILSRDSSKHKYIVFSFFTSMLDLVEPYLKRDGLVYARYDGQMRNDMREASLERLRNQPSTRILLCSLRAGSLGLNLTAASRVVILEPFGTRSWRNKQSIVCID